MLAMTLQGPALLQLKRVDRNNGLETWRLLCQRYEGASAGRLHALLQRVMRPDPFPQDARGFEQALESWELLGGHGEEVGADAED